MRRGKTPTLLTGPENLGRAAASAIQVEVRLYPPFGLMGQDRTRTPALEEVLQNAGIVGDQRVGVLGWKYYSLQETRKTRGLVRDPRLHRRHVAEDRR